MIHLLKKNQPVGGRADGFIDEGVISSLLFFRYGLHEEDPFQDYSERNLEKTTSLRR
jgi:hypothetical protein